MNGFLITLAIICSGGPNPSYNKECVAEILKCTKGNQHYKTLIKCLERKENEHRSN